MASGPSTGPNPLEDDSDEPTEIVSEVLYACGEILKRKGIITDKIITSISDHAWQLGDELANILLEMVENQTEVEELFADDEIVESVSTVEEQNILSQECSQVSSTTGKHF